MNVVIGTEAVQFLLQEYIYSIFGTVLFMYVQPMNVTRALTLLEFVSARGLDNNKELLLTLL
jgi:hypothetical protein